MSILCIIRFLWEKLISSRPLVSFFKSLAPIKKYINSYYNYSNGCTTLLVDVLLYNYGREHRYLRKVDCSTHISLWKIQFDKTTVLVAGAKQKQTDLATLIAYLAYLLCFVRCAHKCLLFSVFAAATNSTNQTNKAAIEHSIFYVMSMVRNRRVHVNGSNLYWLMQIRDTKIYN